MFVVVAVVVVVVVAVVVAEAITEDWIFTSFPSRS